jgi:hypothetical protein
MKEKKAAEEPTYCCEVCGEKHGLNDLRDYEIKGKIRRICEGCVAAIKGIA